VIQRLLNSSVADIGLAFLYFDHKQAESRMSSEYIASLLRQLEEQKQCACSSVQKAYETLSPQRQKPDLPTLKSLLLDSSKSFKSRTYIVLDAFDECTADGRGELIETIRMLRDQNAEIYLFITSRPHSSLDILSASSPNTTRTVKVIAGEGAQTQDVKSYLDGKLARQRIEDEERLFIVEGILEKAKGLYHHFHSVTI
jgi:hypothetical protein